MHLSEAFNRYIQDRIIFANRSAKTEEHYRYTLKSLLTFLEADIALVTLTFDKLRSYKLWLEKRGLGSGTVKGYIVNTRAVLRYMTLLGEECLDPERIPTPAREDQTPHVVTAEEVSKLIETCKNARTASTQIRLRNMAIISLLYGSGIRISEMCRLDRDDVNKTYFTVYGKGNKTRPAFMDERTQTLLKNYLLSRADSNRALFVDQIEHKRLTPSTVQTLFRDISRRAGLTKPVHPHTLRHSFATNLMTNGCHIYPLSRLMGHSNIATTQVYLHMYDGELAEAHQKYHSI